MLQAERDKGVMHEQLAFLKVQLQYALKVRGTGEPRSPYLDNGSRAANTHTLCCIVNLPTILATGVRVSRHFISITNFTTLRSSVDCFRRVSGRLSSSRSRQARPGPRLRSCVRRCR